MGKNMQTAGTSMTATGGVVTAAGGVMMASGKSTTAIAKTDDAKGTGNVASGKALQTSVNPGTVSAGFAQEIAGWCGKAKAAVTDAAGTSRTTTS